MSVSMDSLKAGLDVAGLKYAVAEEYPDVCVVNFEGVILTLHIVGDGRLLYFSTQPMMVISELTDCQQALVGSHLNLWNAALHFARLSTESTGEIFVEASMPIDEDSVVSSRLLTSIILFIVSAWAEKREQLRVLLTAMAMASKSTEKQRAGGKASEHNRFHGFFSDN
jgi:hypothetical protein